MLSLIRRNVLNGTFLWHTIKIHTNCMSTQNRSESSLDRCARDPSSLNPICSTPAPRPSYIHSCAAHIEPLTTHATHLRTLRSSANTGKTSEQAHAACERVRFDRRRAVHDIHSGILAIRLHRCLAVYAIVYALRSHNSPLIAVYIEACFSMQITRDTTTATTSEELENDGNRTDVRRER